MTSVKLILALCAVFSLLAIIRAEPLVQKLYRFKRQFDETPTLEQALQNLQNTQNSQQNSRPWQSGQSSNNQFPSWNNPNQGFQGGNGGNVNQGGSNFQLAATTQRPVVNQIASQNTVNEAECIRTCGTNQWNPVCGTDGISYANTSKLRCAQQCGRQVAFVYNGSCIATPAPNK